jgi:hypothetical protein
MRELRRTTWMRRVMAAAMAFVFAQGLVGTFAHFEFEEHYYCAEHQRFTHDRQHAERDRSMQAQAVSPAPTDGEDTPSDEEPGPQDCLWMSWMQSSSQASPDLAPEMLDLPPPAGDEQTETPRPHQFTGRPVAIHHVSPINSPPRV